MKNRDNFEKITKVGSCTFATSDVFIIGSVINLKNIGSLASGGVAARKYKKQWYRHITEFYIEAGAFNVFYVENNKTKPIYVFEHAKHSEPSVRGMESMQSDYGIYNFTDNIFICNRTLSYNITNGYSHEHGKATIELLSKSDPIVSSEYMIRMNLNGMFSIVYTTTNNGYLSQLSLKRQ